MSGSASQQIDRNHKVISSNEAFIAKSDWTFAAATTGAVGAHTVFTVTGDVLVLPYAICDTLLTGSGTLELGTANNTAALIAQTTGTAIDANEVWQNATPTLEVGAALGTAKPLANGADIVLTIATDTITAGAITFYCQWRPMSTDGSVTVTTPA